MERAETVKKKKKEESESTVSRKHKTQQHSPFHEQSPVTPENAPNGVPLEKPVLVWPVEKFLRFRAAKYLPACF